MNISLHQHYEKLGQEKLNKEKLSKTTDQIRETICVQLDWILSNIDTSKAPALLLETRVLLEALPLSTSEFGLYCARLNNALRYIEATERGAAKYELRLLLSSLSPYRSQ